MADVFKMPKLGETVTKGTVTRWLLAVGDPVNFDDPLLEISTDKVDSEIPSPFAGTLLEILVPEGETVDVGTDLARIGPPEEAATPHSAPAAEAAPTQPAPAPTPAPAPAPASSTTVDSRPPLSPVVRKIAADNGIDLANLKGSGPGGRILREDVEAAVAAASLSPRDEVQPMSRIRFAIAERMAESLRVSPHVWTSVEVDLQAIEEVRSRHKERFRAEEGMSLTYLPFVARAVCDALRAIPVINSSVDMQAKTITLHHYVNLGIAVDINEQGMAVPVIRDADQLSLRELARAIRAVADKLRSGQATADDLSGSTFTITNPGPLGDYASMPIINQPNVAILSTNMVSRRPTAVGDAIAVHYMTILGFSYDHRALDGVTGSRFLAHVRDALQTRDWAAELD
jgi:pyruvate dehydrogenase E2 component (dihydrolipoamide acetyltransferase)